MAVLISMLRGVNVGGHHMIKMDTLRGLCESLNLRDPCTHGQSGNLIFRTGERNLNLLARRIGTAIERSAGFRPEVMVRTSSELRDVIAGNPFARRDDIDPTRFVVVFLASEPEADAREEVLRIKAEPEEIRISGRELYIYYPNGLARPKLSWMALEKLLKTPGTARNWNTVTRLLEIAQRLED